MKKYYLALTICFVLAACAGGGGGHGGVGTARAVIAPDSAVTQSNAAITSMASEVLIGNGKTITPSVSRSGIAQYGGHTYISYRLDDVTFKFSGEDSIIKFGLDDEGRIISAGKYDKDGNRYVLSDEGLFTRTADDGAEFSSAKTMYGWEQEFVTDNDALTTAIATALGTAELPEGVTASSLAIDIAGHFADPVSVRSDNSSIDVGAALENEVADEINDWAASQPYSGDWLADVATAAITYYQSLIPDTFDAPVEYVVKLNIKGADIGLKYADLGFAELQIAEKDNPENVVQRTFAPYAGGYDAAKRKVRRTMEFTGTALAGVEHKYANGNKDSVLVRQDDAVLTLNIDGSSELVMDNLVHVQNDGETPDIDGAHWYELTVQKDAEGVPTFVFNGTNTIDGYDLLHEPTGGTVEFADTDYNANEQEYIIPDTENGVRYGGFVENHTYGASASDVEAISRFSFSDEDTNTHEEVAIYGVFGGQPTPAE